MKVDLAIEWKLGADAPAPVDNSVFVLLNGIRESGSLQESCRRANLSYRHAWGLLAAWAAKLGRPLVELQRGRGSQLTSLGSALLAARARVESRFATEFAQLAEELAEHLSAPPAAIARRWRVFASHDLALLKDRERISQACGVDFEISVHGSLDCLDAFARQRCDVAGFHLPGNESPEHLLRGALGRRSTHDVRLIEFAKREQGLMLRPGLAEEIKSLADVVRSGARFINRQRGSGTRILFDQLLKNANLRPNDIRGYYDEEFTHLAVAATIAGGGADAAFGIRAAAAQFGLPFVLLERETYYLACREERADAGHISRLVTFLQGAEFRSSCAALPGYDVARSGVDSLLRMRPSRVVPRHSAQTSLQS